MSQQSPTSFAPHSPWPPSNSSDGQEPPAKRQRLSPNPPGSSQPTYPPALPAQSSYGNVPNYANFNLPNAAFGNRPQVNGGSDGNHGTSSYSQPQFNPQAQQSRPMQGTMGPPQRPVERATEKPVNKKEEKVDVNDLSDLVYSSGIDIREEENYLTQSYRVDQSQSSSNTQSSSSFTGQHSFGSQGSYGVISSQHGNLPSTSQRNPQDVINEQHKKKARELNETNQFHLANPFLRSACVRTRLESLATENGVKMPIEGLFDRINNTDRAQNTSTSTVSNANGSVTVTRASSILNKNTPLEGILCLLSIAANERVRNLLEDAHGLAKSRQTQSDGVVPPEWSDLARKEGTEQTTAVPTSVTNTAWDMGPDNAISSLTTSQNPGLPSPPPSVDSNPTSKAQPTVALPPSKNPLATALTTLSSRDRAAEEARIKKRAAREARKHAATAASNEESSTAEAHAIIQQVNEKAPEVKMTKKEKERLAKQDMSEEVQTRHTNAVAAMQVGGKRYSWMSAGSAGTPARRPVPAASNKKADPKTSEKDATGKTSKDKDAKDEKKEPQFGDWREDGPGGKGVQLRDWVSILEADGHETKTLYRAYAGLGAEAEGIVPRPPPPILPQVDTTMQNQYQGQNYGQYSGGNTPVGTPGYGTAYGNGAYPRSSPAPPTPSGPLAASAPVSARSTPVPQGSGLPHPYGQGVRSPMPGQASSPNPVYNQNQPQGAARSPVQMPGQTPSTNPGQSQSPTGPVTSPSLNPGYTSTGQGQARSPMQTNGANWSQQVQQSQQAQQANQR